MTGETILHAYFFVGGALFLLVLLGLVVSASLPGLDKRSKRFFIASFSVLALSIVAYVVDLFIYKNPDMAWAGRIISFIETFLPSILMLFLTTYVLRRCGKNIRKSALFYTVLSLCAALLVLLVITQFTDAIYYFTEDNRFVRGKWYSVLIIPIIILIAVNLVEVFFMRKQLGKNYFVAFLIYLLPLLTAMVIQSFVSVFLFIVVAVSISALSMFGIIMTDQVEHHLRQQREIANQRARIAVLQMRPHFIYNTMMSIYYLCEQNQTKAQQVVLDFTNYLRKNFNAIAGDDMISFSEELEHTRAYLAVEQAQFEDRFIVEYDTPFTQFRLPPLTLQPIVENAVKHGMNPDSDEPLSIVIKTEKTDGEARITVEDNGFGFRPTDSKEPHIALSNIYERLEMMCKGTLTISPREGGGTSVKVTIPLKQLENKIYNK